MRSSRQNIKFIQDMAKVAAGAFGSFTELKDQVRSMVKEGVEQIMGQMDMVTRAEFERVEGLAQKARERQIELEKRIAALEKSAPAKKAAAVKPTPTKKTSKNKR